MVQNLGGTKFWQNGLHYKLADNILFNAQNYKMKITALEVSFTASHAVLCAR